MTSVVLSDVPVRLFRAWEEHSDALLREYVLGAAGDGYAYSLGDVARARAARNAVGELIQQACASAGKPSAVDLRFTLPTPLTPGDFSMLQAVLDDAIKLARAGEFLTLPSLPELVALRNWVCEEVVAQASGGDPTAWSGASVTAPESPLAQWPGIAELPPTESWLVGDDHNRLIAVSDPAAELLGWDADDLVGQRILAVIPPSLREAHVAGFTHAMVTGEHTLLGHALEVHACTYDGREIPVTLTLHRHSALAGRSVYVATLEERAG